MAAIIVDYMRTRTYWPLAIEKSETEPNKQLQSPNSKSLVLAPHLPPALAFTATDSPNHIRSYELMFSASESAGEESVCSLPSSERCRSKGLESTYLSPELRDLLNGMLKWEQCERYSLRMHLLWHTVVDQNIRSAL